MFISRIFVAIAATFSIAVIGLPFAESTPCLIPSGRDYSPVDQNAAQNPYFPMAALTKSLQEDIKCCNDDARQWVRAFFHDGATYNKADGSGGIDGSLQYELDRPENRGLEATIADFKKRVVEFGVPMADVVALGGNMAIYTCGGPYVAFASGRVDAKGPNAPGLLCKSMDSASTILNHFDRMNLSPREAVAFIGGGHTIAQVHKKNSPELNLGFLISERDVDSSKTYFDTKYFFEVVKPSNLLTQLIPLLAPFKIPADSNLVQWPATSAYFYEFQDSRKFLDAFTAVFLKFQSYTLPKY